MTARKALTSKERAYLEEAVRGYVLALKDLNDEATRLNVAMNGITAAYLKGAGLSLRVAVDLDTGRISELAPAPAVPTPAKRVTEGLPTRKGK